MPKLRLPPLPSSSKWADIIPSKGVKKVTARENKSRVWLASKPLANRFVRDLGIRENEVVVECYSGLGLMTRALLAGGADQTTSADWHKTFKELQGQVGPTAGKVKRHNAGQFTYPAWNVDEAPPPEFEDGKEPRVHAPKLVVANDASVVQLSRGLGFFPDMAPPTMWDFSRAQDPEWLLKNLKKKREFSVYPSVLEQRLVFSPESIYEWGTAQDIMTNPLVYEHLPVYDESKEGATARMRPWEAPAPPLTVVATFPDSTYGDQLLNQWISSVIGLEQGSGRGWFWSWGRVRLALLLPKGMYDRLMGREGETIRCKLGVLAQALFHLRPLTPCHHVPDVDKGSSRTDPRMDAPRPRIGKAGEPARPTVPAPPPTNEITRTSALDFYPHHYRVTGKRGASKKDVMADLDRPYLLGLELMPREKPLVNGMQREEWEYVLRKMFVGEGRTLEKMLPTLAFGAGNLLDKIEQKDGSPYAGEAVPRDTTIRWLTVSQWARVVDVFDKWAFKPEHVILHDLEGEDNREIGMS